jgi:hypothetical protein
MTARVRVGLSRKRRDAVAAGLPAAGDARWQSAPRLSDAAQTAYLPFASPYIPDTGKRLRWLRRSTRLVILADGYPGRLTSGRVLVHPLDGHYLLEALLAEQAERPRRRLHAAIARTAHAIVRRAEPLGDALVCSYADTASSMVARERHISGLPQAYYAVGLTRAAQLLGDDAVQAAADRFFAALVIPVGEGGVLYRTARDVALAQIPTRPRDLILNGWLSMLVSVHAYAELRNSDEARALFAANLRTLRRLLPLYDVPWLRLSRYGLTGPLLMRIGLSGGGAGVTVTDLRVVLPGEGEARLPLRQGARWIPRAYPEDAEVVGTTPTGKEILAPYGGGLRLAAVLTRAGYPRPNRVRFRLCTPRALRLTLTAHIGRYDPAASATVDRTWLELDARSVEAGTHELDIALPYEPIDLFAYPTNFTRGGPGRRLNTYHSTHIVRLRQLAAISGLADLDEWAGRWAQYMRDWPQQPELAGVDRSTPDEPLDELSLRLTSLTD